MIKTSLVMFIASLLFIHDLFCGSGENRPKENQEIISFGKKFAGTNLAPLT
jgi:hypothetical protein